MSLYKKSEIPEHLQKYFEPAEIGLEQSPEEYVNELVGVFREVRRVLRSDGTCWVNLGDSYAGCGKGIGSNHGKAVFTDENIKKTYWKNTGLKSKDLIGIPWRVAFALQADGWYLRQDIIWQKNNPMPESVRDRCTKAHEYIFLLSKSGKYFFDNEAIKEDSITCDPRRPYISQGAKELDGRESWHSGEPRDHGDFSKRNKRSVWQVNTKPYKGAHFATFPSKLIEPCILAGTSEHGVCSVCGSPFKRVTEDNVIHTRKPEYGIRAQNKDILGQNSLREGFRTIIKDTIDWKPTCSCNAPSIPAIVLDPFAGSGTVGEVCKSLNRNSILIELNPDYKTLIEQRIS